MSFRDTSLNFVDESNTIPVLMVGLSGFKTGEWVKYQS